MLPLKKLMPMNKTLYVSDLDGTLLDKSSRISPRSAEIISELSRRGALVSVATARTPATVDPLMRHTFTTIPAITFTGAALWDRNRRAYIDPQFIDRETSATILSTLQSLDIHPLIYTIAPDSIIHAYYSGPMSEHLRKFAGERDNLELKRMHLNTLSRPEAAPIILIFALGPLATLQEAAERLRESGCCSLSCYPDIFNRSNGYLEIFAAGVSKASAVERLKIATGADRLVVFGDNLNDLPMMERADVAVAVAGALPVVKERADVVIGPNSADSVALFMEDDFNSQH